MSATTPLPPAPRRAIFDDDHQDYRDSFRSCLLYTSPSPRDS